MAQKKNGVNGKRADTQPQGSKHDISQGFPPLPTGANDCFDMTMDTYDRYYWDCPSYGYSAAPRSRNVRHAVALVVLFAIGILYYAIPFLYMAALVGSLYYRNSYCIALLVLLISLAVAPMPDNSPLRNHWTLRTIAEYFQIRWIEDTPRSTFSHDERYLAIWCPHGIIPIGGLAAGTVFDSIAPGYYGRVIMAKVLFRLPLLRQLFALFRTIPNDKRALIAAMKRGENVSTWLGGIRELFVSSPDQEILTIKKPKGYAKLAIQSGAHISIYYCFGQNHMYTSSHSVGGKQVQPSFLSRLSNKLGASITLFYGRWYLPIPYQTRVTIVRGPRMEVKQSDTPTQAEIDELHERVLAMMRQLFDKYKKVAGKEHADKELEIR